MADAEVSLASAALLAAGLVAGAMVGSFLAAVLLRWPKGRSAIWGRSACDSCGRTLGPRDLVPILSFLLARGRCRACEAAIDRRHLFVEAAGALIGATAILAHAIPLALATAIFGWWLLLLAALDLEHHWLPDRLTLSLLPAGLLAGWLELGPVLQDRAIGAIAGYLALAAIAFSYRRLRGREGLGGGDPKLLGAVGAWLGWQQLPIVMLGAGLIGLALVVSRRLRGRTVRATDRVPLGTMIALSAWPIWLLIAR